MRLMSSSRHYYSAGLSIASRLLPTYSQLIAMAQTLAPAQKSLASQGDREILCLHVNTTRKIQIIRIPNIPNLPLERVVFPGQHLMFEAIPEAKLEICTSETVTILVPCQQLRVTEIFTEQQTSSKYLA